MGRGGDRLILSEEALVAESLDTGFRNIDVYRTLQKVIDTGVPIKGMNQLFLRNLSMSGYLLAMEICDCAIKKKRGQ